MTADKIIAALTAENSEFRSSAVSLVVDQVLRTPLGELVDPKELARVTVAAFGEPQLERAIERHVNRAVESIRKTIAESGETLGDAVPEQSRGDILAVLASPRGPKLWWLQCALDPALLRELLAPVFQDILLGFVGKIPGAIGGPGAAAAANVGAIIGKLGSSARGGAGRIANAVGGRGKERDNPLSKLASDFSQGAVSAFQTSLKKRLKSDEGREILAKLRADAFEHVMSTELSVLEEDLGRLPFDEIFALAPPLVVHNLGRDLGRRALEQSMEEYFAIEGERPLGDLVDDWGVRDALRGMIETRGASVAQSLFASDEFRDWLSGLLASVASD